MPKWLNKLLIGFITVLVVIAAISVLREQILHDDVMNKVFLATLDSFPFSQFCAGIVCNILHYPLPWNSMQPSEILKDMTILFAMTMVCPLVIGTASAIFLRVPQGWSIDDKEDYMSTFGYRAKELLLDVILRPLCILLTARLVNWLMDWLKFHLPGLAGVLIRVGVLVLVIFASCVFCIIKGNFSVSKVVRYRLFGQLLTELVNVLVVNTLCIAASLTLLNGDLERAMGIVVLMMILLAGIELMLSAFKL